MVSLGMVVMPGGVILLLTAVQLGALHYGLVPVLVQAWAVSWLMFGLALVGVAMLVVLTTWGLAYLAWLMMRPFSFLPQVAGARTYDFNCVLAWLAMWAAYGAWALPKGWGVSSPCFWR
jgi:hypothetical protein